MKGSLWALIVAYLPVLPLTFGVLLLIYRERPHPPGHFWRWLSHEGLLIALVILIVTTLLWLFLMFLAGVVSLSRPAGGLLRM